MDIYVSQTGINKLTIRKCRRSPQGAEIESKHSAESRENTANGPSATTTSIAGPPYNVYSLVSSWVGDPSPSEESSSAASLKCCISELSPSSLVLPSPKDSGVDVNSPCHRGDEEGVMTLGGNSHVVIDSDIIGPSLNTGINGAPHYSRSSDIERHSEHCRTAETIERRFNQKSSESLQQSDAGCSSQKTNATPNVDVWSANKAERNYSSLQDRCHLETRVPSDSHAQSGSLKTKIIINRKTDSVTFNSKSSNRKISHSSRTGDGDFPPITKDVYKFVDAPIRPLNCGTVAGSAKDANERTTDSFNTGTVTDSKPSESAAERPKFRFFSSDRRRPKVKEAAVRTLMQEFTGSTISTSSGGGKKSSDKKCIPVMNEKPSSIGSSVHSLVAPAVPTNKKYTLIPTTKTDATKLVIRISASRLRSQTGDVASPSGLVSTTIAGNEASSVSGTSNAAQSSYTATVPSSSRTKSMSPSSDRSSSKKRLSSSSVDKCLHAELTLDSKKVPATARLSPNVARDSRSHKKAKKSMRQAPRNHLHSLSTERIPVLSTGSSRVSAERIPVLSTGHVSAERIPVLSTGTSHVNAERIPVLSTGSSQVNTDKIPVLSMGNRPSSSDRIPAVSASDTEGDAGKTPMLSTGSNHAKSERIPTVPTESQVSDEKIHVKSTVNSEVSSNGSLSLTSYGSIAEANSDFSSSRRAQNLYDKGLDDACGAVGYSNKIALKEKSCISAVVPVLISEERDAQPLVMKDSASEVGPIETTASDCHVKKTGNKSVLLPVSNAVAVSPLPINNGVSSLLPMPIKSPAVRDFESSSSLWKSAPPTSASKIPPIVINKLSLSIKRAGSGSWYVPSQTGKEKCKTAEKSTVSAGLVKGSFVKSYEPVPTTLNSPVTSVRAQSVEFPARQHEMAALPRRDVNKKSIKVSFTSHSQSMKNNQPEPNGHSLNNDVTTLKSQVSECEEMTADEKNCFPFTTNDEKPHVVLSVKLPRREETEVKHKHRKDKKHSLSRSRRRKEAEIATNSSSLLHSSIDIVSATDSSAPVVDSDEKITYDCNHAMSSAINNGPLTTSSLVICSEDKPLCDAIAMPSSDEVLASFNGSLFEAAVSVLKTTEDQNLDSNTIVPNRCEQVISDHRSNCQAGNISIAKEESTITVPTAAAKLLVEESPQQSLCSELGTTNDEPSTLAIAQSCRTYLRKRKISNAATPSVVSYNGLRSPVLTPDESLCASELFSNDNSSFASAAVDHVSQSKRRRDSSDDVALSYVDPSVEVPLPVVNIDSNKIGVHTSGSSERSRLWSANNFDNDLTKIAETGLDPTSKSKQPASAVTKQSKLSSARLLAAKDVVAANSWSAFAAPSLEEDVKDNEQKRKLCLQDNKAAKESVFKLDELNNVNGFRLDSDNGSKMRHMQHSPGGSMSKSPAKELALSDAFSVSALDKYTHHKSDIRNNDMHKADVNQLPGLQVEPNHEIVARQKESISTEMTSSQRKTVVQDERSKPSVMNKIASHKKRVVSESASDPCYVVANRHQSIKKLRTHVPELQDVSLSVNVNVAPDNKCNVAPDDVKTSVAPGAEDCSKRLKREYSCPVADDNCTGKKDMPCTTASASRTDVVGSDSALFRSGMPVCVHKSTSNHFHANVSSNSCKALLHKFEFQSARVLPWEYHKKRKMMALSCEDKSSNPTSLLVASNSLNLEFGSPSSANCPSTKISAECCLATKEGVNSTPAIVNKLKTLHSELQPALRPANYDSKSKIISNRTSLSDESSHKIKRKPHYDPIAKLGPVENSQLKEYAKSTDTSSVPSLQSTISPMKNSCGSMLRNVIEKMAANYSHKPSKPSSLLTESKGSNSVKSAATVAERDLKALASLNNESQQQEQIPSNKTGLTDFKHDNEYMRISTLLPNGFDFAVKEPMRKGLSSNTHSFATECTTMQGLQQASIVAATSIEKPKEIMIDCKSSKNHTLTKSESLTSSVVSPRQIDLPLPHKTAVLSSSTPSIKRELPDNDERLTNGMRLPYVGYLNVFEKFLQCSTDPAEVHTDLITGDILKETIEKRRDAQRSNVAAAKESSVDSIEDPLLSGAAAVTVGSSQVTRRNSRIFRRSTLVKQMNKCRPETNLAYSDNSSSANDDHSAVLSDNTSTPLNCLHLESKSLQTQTRMPPLSSHSSTESILKEEEEGHSLRKSRLSHVVETEADRNSFVPVQLQLNELETNARTLLNILSPGIASNGAISAIPKIYSATANLTSSGIEQMLDTMSAILLDGTPSRTSAKIFTSPSGSTQVLLSSTSTMSSNLVTSADGVVVLCNRPKSCLTRLKHKIALLLDLILPELHLNVNEICEADIVRDLLQSVISANLPGTSSTALPTLQSTVLASDVTSGSASTVPAVTRVLSAKAEMTKSSKLIDSVDRTSSSMPVFEAEASKNNCITQRKSHKKKFKTNNCDVMSSSASSLSSSILSASRNGVRSSRRSTPETPYDNCSRSDFHLTGPSKKHTASQDDKPTLRTRRSSASSEKIGNDLSTTSCVTTLNNGLVADSKKLVDCFFVT